MPLCKIYGLEHKFEQRPGNGFWKRDIVFPTWAVTSLDKGRYSHRFVDVLKLEKPLEQRISQEALDWANDRFQGKRPIVVSIRCAKYQPLRNSSTDWYRWASDHGAHIIPDYLDEKISTERLLACYELASLNIGVHQGRGLLNWFSYRPYLVVKHIIPEYKVMNAKWVAKHQGIKVGDQMPWKTPKQKILWNSEDDYETIEREYQLYLRGA